MSFTPRRVQYPYDALTSAQQLHLVGRNQPLIRKIRIQEQWATFERIENYNDVIYQKYEQGNRGDLYYQYKSNEELNNYNAGRLLHILAYPSLPAATFQPNRDRPLPNVPIIGGIPLETNVPRFVMNRPVPSSSERATFRAELEVYSYVSTYNHTHVLKYTFANDVEKNAYERVDLRINATPYISPPN